MKEEYIPVKIMPIINSLERCEIPFRHAENSECKTQMPLFQEADFTKNLCKWIMINFLGAKINVIFLIFLISHTS